VIPKPEIFILNEILQEVVNLEEPNASQKGILLKLEDDQPLEMNSDKQRIQQIILNLVNNAIKFTDEGSVTIGFYRENSNVRINITDTGIGIKEEDSIKLFKPFIQIESHLARKYQGSGLGLSISKKLAELLGGSIDLKSEFGKGSTFSVVLPIYYS
jgi:signal transduction histidine kinase